MGGEIVQLLLANTTVTEITLSTVDKDNVDDFVYDGMHSAQKLPDILNSGTACEIQVTLEAMIFWRY